MTARRGSPGARRQGILTVDVGTTAVKTTLWDESLTELASHTGEYRLVTTGGLIEVDPGVYTEATRRGIRAVLDGQDAVSVTALALTTQGETLIAAGPDGSPLGNAIVWLDARAQAEAARLREAIDPATFYSTTGLPELNGAVPLAKAMRLVTTLPALALPGARLLFVEDFLVRWLTGRVVSHRSLQTSSGWLNLETDDYWDEALQAAGVERRLLPDLVGSAEPVAPLLPERALELGLPPGVLVVAGAMDQAAAALGAGIAVPGRVGVSFGTALVVTASSPTPVTDPVHLPTTYRHALDGSFLVLLIEPTSGALLTWLRDLLAGDDPDSLDYARLDRLASGVPAGSDGVVALPFFEGGGQGALAPATGGYLGLTLGTGRGHLARSLLEGTSYALRDLLGALAALGLPATELRTSGGGSRSALWQSIVADVCDVEVRPLRSSEASSAGAALLAAWGSGLVAPGVDPRSLDDLAAVTPVAPEAYEPHYSRYRQAVDALLHYWSATTTSRRNQ